jgi:hypothetical protein
VNFRWSSYSFLATRQCRWQHIVYTTLSVNSTFVSILSTELLNNWSEHITPFNCLDILIRRWTEQDGNAVIMKLKYHSRQTFVEILFSIIDLTVWVFFLLPDGSCRLTISHREIETYPSEPQQPSPSDRPIVIIAIVKSDCPLILPEAQYTSCTISETYVLPGVCFVIVILVMWR